MDNEGDRPQPKFRIGQVVIMESLKRPMPVTILDIMWHDGWFYRFNRRNWASEHMLGEQEEH